jgi:RHS repeat-associated protein
VTPPAAGGRTNPFQYNGAAPNSSMTDPTTGLLLLPARSYDPTQGRFTSRDTANVFNKYQGFSTNPIINVDPTGHISLEDLFIDIGMALVFAVVAVASAGAALPAIAAARVGTLTTTAIVTTVAEAVTAAAAATGFVASTVKAANDGDQVVNGKHFLSTDQRNALSTVQAVAGAVAAVSGLASVGAASAGAIAEDATQDAADFLPDTDGAGDDGGGASTDANDDAAPRYKRKAVVQGETDDMGYRLPSKTDDVIKGVSSHASEPEPLQQDPTEVISSEQNVPHDVLGSARLNGTEKALLDDNPAVATSLNSADTSESLLNSSFEEVSPPTQTATNGNWIEEARVYDEEVILPRDYFVRSWGERLAFEWSELKNSLYTRLGNWLTS